MKRWRSLVVMLLAQAGAFLYAAAERSHRHGFFSDRVRLEFLSLANKRPANVSRKQWEGVVAHTINAWANCLAFPAAAFRRCRVKPGYDSTGPNNTAYAILRTFFG